MRHLLLALAAATLCACAFGASPALPDLGLQDVSLACDDGTNLNTALDATSLTALANAVSAIDTTPAGLTCASSQSATGGPKDLAVGGGELIADCTFYGGTGLVHYSFALSAHSDADAPTSGVGGTFNVDIPQQGGTCPVYGHTVAKIDCLAVVGNHADMTGVITQSTGTYLGPQFVGAEESISVTDNGDLPDTIDASVTDAPCAFNEPFEQPIAQGNITVHDATP